MRTMLSQLELVYPPFSNQEGVWLWDDGEVKDYLKDSKLYMIVQRTVLKFVDYEFIPKEFGIFRFKLKMGNVVSPYINLDLKKIFDYFTRSEDGIVMELGDKLFRVKDEVSDKVIYWCTPDVFLFYMWRGVVNVRIEAPFDFRVFTNFKLHYVGISKKNDSFSRLFGEVHHGRLNILSSEYTEEESSRLTDELLMLLFDINKLNINIMENEGDLDSLFHTVSDLDVIIDAEKAFINLLDTKYNEVKYSKYPKSKDGLEGNGLDSYTFAVNEQLTISTESAEIRGIFLGDNYKLMDYQDHIMVDGEKAIIIKAFKEYCVEV